MNANRAWLILAAGVIGYDLWCKPGETLSEGADKWILKHPWLARLGLGVVAVHVANLVPAKADPIHLGFNAAKRLTYNGREHG